MATPLNNSNGLVYPLVLAYALVLLSLWKLDAGISGSSFLVSSGDNNIDATRLATSRRFAPSRPDSGESMLQQAVIDSLNGGGSETKQDQLRRLAALALIKHVAEDGIRRGRAVEPRSPKDGGSINR